MAIVYQEQQWVHRENARRSSFFCMSVNQHRCIFIYAITSALYVV
jgi:hypothetical protein